MVLVVVMVIIAVSLIGMLIYVGHQDQVKREQEAEAQRVFNQQLEAGRQKAQFKEQERQRSIHEKFQREYEQRKQAIGRIVCPQCKWTGNWGDGMSYEEFFIYELVEVNKVRVSHRVDTNIHVLNSESQYKCPVCKSTNWQKV